MGSNPSHWRATIAAAPEARFEGGRSKLKYSDVTLAISILTWIIVSLER